MKIFCSSENSCTFVPLNQVLDLFQISKKYFLNISVKVCIVVMLYSKCVSTWLSNTHSRIFLFIRYA